MEEEELGELPADAPVDNTACQIYVGNLSWQATEEVLRAEFEDIGRVVNVKVLIDHETGHNKGYCFITFEDEESAIRAIAEKNGKALEGRSMKVNNALGSNKGRDNDDRYYKPRNAWGKGGKGNGGPRGSVFGEGRLEEDPYPEGRARGPRGPEGRDWQHPGRGVSGREARDGPGRERDDPYESEHPPPRAAYRESRGPTYDDFGLQPDSRDRPREAYRDGYRGEGRRSSYRSYGEGHYPEAAFGGPEAGYRDSYAYPEETEGYVAPVRDAAYRQAPSRDTYEPDYERSGGYEAGYERAPVGYRSEAPYPSRRVGHAEGGYARSGNGDYGAPRGGGPPVHSAYDDDGYSYYESQPRGGKDYTKDYAEREYQGRDYGAKRDVARGTTAWIENMVTDRPGGTKVAVIHVARAREQVVGVHFLIKEVQGVNGLALTIVTVDMFPEGFDMLLLGSLDNLPILGYRGTSALSDVEFILLYLSELAATVRLFEGILKHGILTAFYQDLQRYLLQWTWSWSLLPFSAARSSKIHVYLAFATII
ncbi:hypothetical protein CYMTET_26685 [Cymbomonas tetramitiformis]|uniref:RRM domain-containing protein n=1 Tax=Cymbomonas tetramitiformis TaxID=36881 RepID=A0AAE0KXP2_9CHLO|nr:hypothetical protein CYMTET_26685 [Cymbomonas tetramitiformis]